MSQHDALDLDTIDLWQREHEHVIADSQPGSYAAHVSQQMLMVLATARAYHALREAVERGALVDLAELTALTYGWLWDEVGAADSSPVAVVQWLIEREIKRRADDESALLPATEGQQP